MGILMRNGVPYAHGSEIPQGGTKGQVLAKASDIDGDFEWTSGSSGVGATEIIRNESYLYSDLITTLQTKQTILKLDDVLVPIVGYSDELDDSNPDLPPNRVVSIYANIKSTKEQESNTDVPTLWIFSWKVAETDKDSVAMKPVTSRNVILSGQFVAVPYSTTFNDLSNAVLTNKQILIKVDEYPLNGYYTATSGIYMGTVVLLKVEDIINGKIINYSVTSSGWSEETTNASDSFVVDTANPCSYNELQSAISASKVILIKHEGVVYPFVEKWESDENTKRYVNIASLQRQGVDKGAMYFFFEATIDYLDSPMAYSSNFAQPTGKPYTDSITGNLSNLNTVEKTNLVGAINEANGKTGLHIAVGKEKWCGTYEDENGVVYQMYTKQIYIPALPATSGITKYEHGISNIKQILDIYGSTTDGFVLNAPRQTVSDNISIYQASKSDSNKTFSIEVGKDRSSKSAYVTVVYAKNN